MSETAIDQAKSTIDPKVVSLQVVPKMTLQDQFKIIEVPGFQYNGQLFPTRLEAIDSAIMDIATKIQKERSSVQDIKNALLGYGSVLVNLLTEYEQLKAIQSEDTSPEVQAVFVDDSVNN